jgi:hypothetical protein
MTYLRLYETPELGVHQTGSSSVYSQRATLQRVRRTTSVQNFGRNFIWLSAIYSCMDCGLLGSKTDSCLIMPVALEINFALWIMIGCAVLEAAQYLD